MVREEVTYPHGVNPSSMDSACSYCGSDVYKHNAIFVEEDSDDGREQAGQFCNYACLEAYIDENELTEGACCQIEL